MILVDTQALLWFTEGDTRLGKRARLLVSEEWKAEQLGISAMSLWEIGMLIEKRRIALSVSLPSYLQRLVNVEKLKVVAVDRAIATESGQLPEGLPGEPGDRLIAATTRIMECTLLTADSMLLDYATAGHLQAIDARL